MTNLTALLKTTITRTAPRGGDFNSCGISIWVSHVLIPSKKNMLVSVNEELVGGTYFRLLNVPSEPAVFRLEGSLSKEIKNTLSQ